MFHRSPFMGFKQGSLLKEARLGSSLELPRRKRLGYTKRSAQLTDFGLRYLGLRKL
jgi:hypothetical protein